jgi:hypothetical protein
MIMVLLREEENRRSGLMIEEGLQQAQVLANGSGGSWGNTTG